MNEPVIDLSHSKLSSIDGCIQIEKVIRPLVKKDE